ncbi:hypothetical protein OSJ57_17685 [Sphingomonas sp. HH69]
MAVKKAERKKARRAKVELVEVVSPTKEAQALGTYVRAGMAFRRVPIIDQLLDQDRITDEQHRALTYYRDQCGIAARSPTRSCIDFSPKGAGHGPSAAMISAAIEEGRLNRALGALQSITYAVAVDDMSLTQWCIQRYGSRMEGRAKNGATMWSVVPKGKNDVQGALVDLKFAAGRILAEIGARR